MRAKQLLSAATAANSPPSAATDGIALSDLGYPDEALFALKSTAGSGTMSVTIRLWLYLGGDIAAWFPMGTGADGTKGTINAGSAMGETATDSIRHVEHLAGLCHADRIYAEIPTDGISGTLTAVSAWIVQRDNERND